MDKPQWDRVRTRVTGLTAPKAAVWRSAGSITLLSMAVGLLILTGWPGPCRVWAGSFTTTLTVTAQVLPFVKLTMLSQQEELVISESDVYRGFVEINNGSLIEINNNNLNGCCLVLEVNDFPFEWASVDIQGRAVTLPARGGFIDWPSQGSMITPVHYVIVLKPGTSPGVYPWPFRLTASANNAY